MPEQEFILNALLVSPPIIENSSATSSSVLVALTMHTNVSVGEFSST